MATRVSGKLYVVATPIGNLGDISERALSILRGVGLVAAEDTRHSKQLLRHFGIGTRCVSFHEHNEAERVGTVCDTLIEGTDVALVSDAGTPLISDPGYSLVREVLRRGLQVVPIPGPSALIAALSVAGLPTDHFRFEGFLPAKSTARQRRLNELVTETVTLVFYESSHRIQESLSDMVDAFGPQRAATLCRELTKIHETIRHADLNRLLQEVTGDENQRRGEFVLVVQGAPVVAAEPQALDGVLRILLKELSTKQAARLAAQICGSSRNAAYDRALELGSSSEAAGDL